MNISKDKISDGYRKCKRHIETLLNSSSVLLDSGLYSTSLALSILAREEIAKLMLLQDHLKDETEITPEQWDELARNTKKSTAHKARLTYSMKAAREGVQSFSKPMFEAMKAENERMGIPQNLTYEQVMQVNDEFEKQFEKLDGIKQECMYLGWDGKWISLPIKLEANEIHGLSYIHLNDVKGMYYSTISVRIHKMIKRPIEETLKDDPNFQTWLKLRRERNTSHYKKMHKFATQAMEKI